MSSTIDDSPRPDFPALDVTAGAEAAPPAVETDAEAEQAWQVPPAQPLRLVAAVLLLASGAAAYAYTLTNFWSSPSLGIHMAIPWPSYLLIAMGLILALFALRVALGLWSPHAKLAIAGISFLACLTFGVGGGRFISYTLRGTRNPPFELHLRVGDRFPDFELADQNNVARSSSKLFTSTLLTLVVIYRGDFCPFARFELGELSRRQDDFRKAGIQIVGISADPPQRSTMLSRFLHSDLPLLSDPAENLLGRLGLVQHYRDHQPDSAIPAFVLVDRHRRVRWIFTSPYYRVQPSPQVVLQAARESRN